MTDKQSFLDKLNAALLDRGISETDIRPYLERFDRFYDRMASDPDQVSSDALSDIDNIANNIAAQIAERYEEINRLAEKTMTLASVDPDEPKDDGYELVEEKASTGLIPADMIAEGASEASPSDIPSAEMSRVPNYVDEESSPSSTMFWVLFAVTLPLTIPLAAAAVGIFAAVWGALLILILGAIAALIAVVAGGAILSLVGVIYGITQLFDTAAIGLYEIGMGIVIAGAAMFVGILLYNFAVRLMPFVIRMVGRLFGYLFRQLRVLFNYLRRECAKL